MTRMHSCRGGLALIALLATAGLAAAPSNPTKTTAPSAKAGMTRIAAPAITMKGAPRAAARDDKDRSPASTAKPFVLLTNTVFDGINNELKGADVQMYRVIYQSSDPQAKATGLINPQIIIDEIKKYLGPTPKGYVMLDYENPFDGILKVGPTHEKYEATMASMIAALKAVRAAYPDLKLSYYAAPRLPYWIPGKGAWDKAPQEAKDATINHMMASYAPLVKEMDWLSPSVYDRYELARRPVSEHEILTKRETMWRSAYVAMCREMLRQAGKPETPVIPVFCLTFVSGGDATSLLPIGADEFMRDQIQPCIDAGADGFASWTGLQRFLIISSLAVPKGGITVAQQRSMRDVVRDLFLDGKEPSVWSSTETRAALEGGFGRLLSGYFNLIRAAEPRQAEAQPQAAVAPASADRAVRRSPSGIVPKRSKSAVTAGSATIRSNQR